MKKFALLLLIVVLVLLVVVVGRTLRVTSQRVSPEPFTPLAVDEAKTAGDLAQALRFETVSFQAGQVSKPEAFLALHRYFEQAFPRVHATLTRELIADYSLLYTWKGTDPNLKPIVLMAHQDVVPISPGSESKWTHPPFAGQIADGYVWGRGALDDKASLVAILEAVEALLAQGYQPRRTIYLAFGHDEEVLGSGAREIALTLRARGVAPEFVLDEGAAMLEGIVPGISGPLAMVDTSEKGYVSFELVVEGTGGHSAMPPKQTVITTLTDALSRLHARPMPTHLFGPAGRLVEHLAPEVPFSQRMTFANLWLFGPLVEREMSATPRMSSYLRTTLATTMLEAGVKENVIPTRARAVVNSRILPGDTVESVAEHVRAAINDPRVQVRVLGTSNGPSPESPTDSLGYRAIERTVRQVFPRAPVVPGMVVGATDSRHFAVLTSSIYRFVPATLGPQDLSRPHGTDERIATKDFATAVQFYAQLIRNAAL